LAWLGVAGKVCLGKIGQGMVRYVSAGKVSCAMVRLCRVWYGRQGPFRWGKVRHVLVCSGKAGVVSLGLA
jgi:hypothetical protein